MKYNTRIHLLGALAVIATVAACQPRPEAPVAKTGPIQMYIHKDKLTGCDYLVATTYDGYRSGSAITPRLWSDGTQICRE